MGDTGIKYPVNFDVDGKIRECATTDDPEKAHYAFPSSYGVQCTAIAADRHSFCLRMEDVRQEELPPCRKWGLD